MDKLNTRAKQTASAFGLLLGLEVINLLNDLYFGYGFLYFLPSFYALYGWATYAIYLGIIVPTVGLLLTFLITQKGIKASYGFIPILIFYFVTSLWILITKSIYVWNYPLETLPRLIIYFGIVGLLFYGTIPMLRASPKNKESISEELSDKDFLPTLILCFFVGMLGIHRFYAGKVGTGIAMIVTLGGLGIWVLVDFIMICIGSFRDIDGRIIKYQRAVIAPSSSETGIAEELEKFAELKDKGIISEEEFNKKKEELLN